MDDTEPPRELSAGEAARLAGVPERTIRRWVISGVLRADRSGPTLRIDLTALAPWLTRAARRPEPARRTGPSKASRAGPTARPTSPAPAAQPAAPSPAAKPASPVTVVQPTAPTTVQGYAAPVPTIPEPPVPPAAPVPERLDPAEVRALMGELRATLRDRTEAAEFWKARAELLAAQLNETTQRLRVLEAQTLGGASAPVVPSPALPPALPPAHPWWAFLRRLGRSTRVRRRGRRGPAGSR